MSQNTRDLPDYKNPPVSEVSLAVQFETLNNFRMTYFGLLWTRFREDFPRVEEHPPRESTFEDFGPQKPRKIELKIEQGIPVPRFWFLNDSGTELIQVQQDRFVHNWRKLGDEHHYPRYEKIRETFKQELNTFIDFVKESDVGELVFNQCEITYLNHIPQGEAWERRGQLDDLFTVWKNEFSDDFLEEPEDGQFSLRYIIPNNQNEAVGRLHISLQPGYRSTDNKPIKILSLTARGKPIDSDLNGIFSFLDLGREWIVRGFTSVTTPRMHEKWGRCL